MKVYQLIGTGESGLIGERVNISSRKLYKSAETARLNQEEFILKCQDSEYLNFILGKVEIQIIELEVVD